MIICLLIFSGCISLYNSYICFRQKYITIMKRCLLYILILFVSFSSCQNSTAIQTQCTGRLYEICVVVKKTEWQSSMGDTLKNFFRQPMNGLPQDEPMFNMFSVPLSSFGPQLKSHRNVFEVKISKKKKKPQLYIKRDFMARQQVYVRMVVNSKKQFFEFFEKRKAQIMDIFLDAEQGRLMKYYTKYPDAKIFNKLKSKYGYILRVPTGYNINKDTLGFVWISSETSKNSKGMFVYSYDYNSQEQFSLKNIVAKRNNLLKSFVPGPLPKSYMTTASTDYCTIRKVAVDSCYAVEVRGLWKVDGDYMGGPFVSLSILDEKRQKVVCVDGYVYSPNEDKRNMLRKVEAVMNTLSFIKTKKK